MTPIIAENKKEDKLIYHYCSNETFAKIISNKELWMCDILKSNDYDEMKLLLPSIYNAIRDIYLENPFEFKYANASGIEALVDLIEISIMCIHDNIEDGEFTNYVVCFCEDGDALGQWRGYGNNGKGVSLGFSVNTLHEMCSENNNVFILEKIEYITKEKLDEVIKSYARNIVSGLKGLREWIVENMTFDDEDEDTDGLLFFNFHSFVEQAVIESLKYKDILFKEENEWRMFFARNTAKNAEWIIGEEQDLIGPKLFDETIRQLRNRTKFKIMEDDLVAYYPLDFSNHENSLLKEIIIGPKNWSYKVDLKLYLASNNIVDCKIENSNITYR